MVPKIKIISITGKWANILYTSSNARSRQTLVNILDEHESGKIEITNPGRLRR